MKKELSFTIPFSGFESTNFINCFASTYLFLEKIGACAETGYVCNQQENGQCNGCGNCASASVQDRYFFLFDTMCGRSSLRCRFDGKPTKMQKMIGETDFYDGGTENTIEFLFGFAGYEYRRLTDPSVFKNEIIASIDAGKPVIAKVKTRDGRFRVITGYDDDILFCPDFSNAQQKPQGAPSYDELTDLYRIGNKVAPRYTLVDGLKRIRQVMEYNSSENLWGGYMEKMGLYTPDSLTKAGLGEKKARMKRVSDTMWHTFNSHNFAEVFRQRSVEELKKPELDDICRKIGGPYYGYTHDLAWALIGLEECADWTKHAAGYFGEMIDLTIRQIQKNDIAVLEEIKRAIQILER